MALFIVEERGTAIKGWQQAGRINLRQAMFMTYLLDSVLVVSGMGQAMVMVRVSCWKSAPAGEKEAPCASIMQRILQFSGHRLTLHKAVFLQKLFPLPTSFFPSIKFLCFLPSLTQILLPEKIFY